MRPLSAEMLRSLVLDADEHPRGRKHYNLHYSYEEPCQRLFNAVGVDSYIRPHRHTHHQREETLLAVRGLLALFVFDENGTIVSTRRFGSQAFDGECDGVGVELVPGEWHTVIALVPGSVIFEVKTGPFDPSAAKEFAPWSPAEGTADAEAFMKFLRQRLDIAGNDQGVVDATQHT